MKKELFMKMPVTEKIFAIMFQAEAKSLDFVEILKYYNINKQDLYSIMWKKFNIPGMETRIANTAFDFLIMKCVWRKKNQTKI